MVVCGSGADSVAMLAGAISKRRRAVLMSLMKWNQRMERARRIVWASLSENSPPGARFWPPF